MSRVEVSTVSRRSLLLGSAAATASLTLPISVAAAPKRSLRLAFLTDIHLQPEQKAGEGLAACLRHIEAQKDRPDFIMTGGDLIMDAMIADYDRTDVQWKLFTKVFAENTELPVEHCIGNHDVWSFASREDNPAHAAKAVKKWAMDVLKLERPYRSFNRSGWHFIVLDSTHVREGDFKDGSGYIGQLDEEQFQWLTKDLESTPSTTPICIVSHIPIVSASVYFFDDMRQGVNYVVPGMLMHYDAARLKDLFYKHPNVKVALSGHIHLVDHIEYLGVTYLGNGAVSGAWWSGDWRETKPGYALVDLFDDGSVHREYVPYGWVAQP